VGDIIAAAGVVWLHFVIMVVSSIIFGILALVLQKVLMVVGTSFGGSFMIASAVDFLAVHSNFSLIIPMALRFNFDTVKNADWRVYVMIAGFVVFGIIGSVVQFALTARNFNHNKKKKSDNEYGKLDQKDIKVQQPDPSKRRNPDPVSRGHTDRVPLRDRSRNY